LLKRKKCFEHLQPDDYREENKINKWNSAFWANAGLDNARESMGSDSYLKI
jgi:hypothetical protein